MLKETGFYLQDSNLGGGGWEHFPCYPSGYEPKTCPEVPISLSVCTAAVQTVLYPLWKGRLWVSEPPSSRSSSLPQDLGCVVLGLHVVVQETCAVLHSVMVESREAHIPREWLFYVLRRIKSLHFWSQFSSKASPVNPRLVRQVAAQLHQLSPYTLPSAHVAPSSLPQATGPNPDSQPAWLLPCTPALMADCFTTNHSCLLLPRSELSQIPLLLGSFLMAASLMAAISEEQTYLLSLQAAWLSLLFQPTLVFKC